MASSKSSGYSRRGKKGNKRNKSSVSSDSASLDNPNAIYAVNSDESDKLELWEIVDETSEDTKVPIKKSSSKTDTEDEFEIVDVSEEKFEAASDYIGKDWAIVETPSSTSTPFPPEVQSFYEPRRSTQPELKFHPDFVVVNPSTSPLSALPSLYEPGRSTQSELEYEPNYFSSNESSSIEVLEEYPEGYEKLSDIISDDE